MDLVTCHLNADFDALASVVAAGMLYPGAAMALPGPPAAAAARFLSLHKDVIPVGTRRSIDLSSISRLIVVDCARPDRLGPFAELADTPGVDVHVYDHHPDGSIRGSVHVVEPVGATVTILVERLVDRRIPIDELSATLFVLGIYEDTNCLTFTTATARDARAVAALLDRGANLAVVDSYMEHSLTTEQQELLTALASTLETRPVAGGTVGVAAVTVSGYVGGLALLVHRLQGMAGLSAVFVAAGMNGKTFIVGRSDGSALDVIEVLQPWQGKGHVQAASATVRAADPAAIGQQIMTRVVELARPALTAADIMATPVRTIDSDCSVDQALILLERYGHSGLPIVDDDGALTGIISRRDLDKAKRHGLGHAPVRGFMSREVITVGPDTPVPELRELMVSRDKGRLPVIEQGKLAGIVTRTDILKELYGVADRPGRRLTGVPSGWRSRNVTRRLLEQPDDIRAAIDAAANVGQRRGETVHLVGGMVRDLLLGVNNWDVDLAVEGDGLEFARELALTLRGQVREHAEFGTATVLWGGLHVDVAGARREHYERAAALPRVERGGIKEDMARRDFTINAMAVQLTEPGSGDLLDFFGGQRDLVSGRLRVLHNLSFIDDPARLFRMVRFETRYGFGAEPDTERFAREAVREEILDLLTDERYSAELMLVLDDAEVPAAVVRMADLGMIAGLTVTAAGRIGADVPVALAAASGFRFRPPIDDRLVWLTAIMRAIPPEGRDLVRSRLRLTRRAGELVRASESLDNLLSILGGETVAASAIYDALSGVPAELAALAWAEGKELVRSRILAFWERLGRVTIAVTGHDLKAHGFQPGPLFQETLRALRSAVLDGEVAEPGDQLGWAIEYIERRARQHQA